MLNTAGFDSFWPSDQAAPGRNDVDVVQFGEAGVELAHVMSYLEEGFRQIEEGRAQTCQHIDERLARQEEAFQSLFTKHMERLERNVPLGGPPATSLSRRTSLAQPHATLTHSLSRRTSLAQPYGTSSVFGRRLSNRQAVPDPSSGSSSSPPPPAALALNSRPCVPHEQTTPMSIQQVAVMRTKGNEQDHAPSELPRGETNCSIASSFIGRKGTSNASEGEEDAPSPKVKSAMSEGHFKGVAKGVLGQVKFKRFHEAESAKKSLGQERFKTSEVVSENSREKSLMTMGPLGSLATDDGTRKMLFTWMIRSTYFDAACAFILLTNSLFIGLQVEYTASNKTTVLPTAFLVADYMYTFWFVMELLLRLFAIGPYKFFLGDERSWNWFDLVIVGTGLVESMTSLIVANDEASILSNLSALRTLRIARVARVARVIRLMRFFRSLRILVKAILNTMKNCLWTALLLCMIMYIFGILFAQGVSDHFSSVDYMAYAGPEADVLREYFGSLPRSIFTCFKAVQGGIDWEPAARALSDLGAFYVMMFVMEVFIVNLVVLNVVSGLFLQGAIEQAQADLDDIIAHHMQEKSTYVKRFEKVFKEMDRDGDECISLVEFCAALDHQPMRDLLNALDIEENDAWTLFKLLDIDSSGSVDLDEFVKGCMSLKGNAKSIHIAQQTYETRWMMDAFEDLMQFIEGSFGHYQDELHHELEKTKAELGSASMSAGAFASSSLKPAVFTSSACNPATFVEVIRKPEQGDAVESVVELA